MELTISVKRLSHGDQLEIPQRATPFSSGIDLAAAIGDSVNISPGKRAVIPTGFIWEIPPGYEGQVRPRSGLACKQGITVLNSPGTIDADYRGEIMVILINLGEADFEVKPGMRIAQLVIQPVCKVNCQVVVEVSNSERGTGGLGSTGQ